MSSRPTAITFRSASTRSVVGTISTSHASNTSRAFTAIGYFAPVRFAKASSFSRRPRPIPITAGPSPRRSVAIRFSRGTSAAHFPQVGDRNCTTRAPRSVGGASAVSDTHDSARIGATVAPTSGPRSHARKASGNKNATMAGHRRSIASPIAGNRGSASRCGRPAPQELPRRRRTSTRLEATSLDVRRSEARGSAPE